MTLKKLFPFLVATMLLSAIASVAQDSEKEMTKMEEVMASHDKVMDKMPKLAKLIGKLQTKADASYKKEKYQNAIEDLKAANKSMMDWMTGFGDRFEADEMLKGKKLTGQKQEWLLEEEKKVADLSNEIRLSISQAEALLDK